MLDLVTTNATDAAIRRGDEIYDPQQRERRELVLEVCKGGSGTLAPPCKQEQAHVVHAY